MQTVGLLHVQTRLFNGASVVHTVTLVNCTVEISFNSQSKFSLISVCLKPYFSSSHHVL